MAIDTQSPFGRYDRFWLPRIVWTICDTPVLSAAIRRRLRKYIARRFKGPFDVEFDGIKWRLYPEENYCDRSIFARQKLPEAAEHAALKDHIKPGMIFVDIGANIGSYSLFVARHANNQAQIVALEPHPDTIGKLRYNLKANAVVSAVVLQLASGPKRTIMPLWSDGGSNIGHTSILKAGTSNAKIAIDVQVVPLAEIMTEQKIAHIDLLKIDVEGFEDQVLLPFFKAAAPELWPRHILIETAHHNIWQQDVTAWMKENGYRVIFETVENLLLQRKMVK